MADFLTENAQFTCTQGGFITCKDSGNSSVKYNGATLLTAGATVKTKAGICATLTAMAQGTPQICKCQLTAWAPAEIMKNSGGAPLLTDSTKNTCIYGGIISAQMSGVLGKVATGFTPAAMTMGAASLVNVEKVPENISAANKNISPKIENSADSKQNNPASNAKIENPKKTDAPKLLSKPSKNLFCPYDENNEKCKNCTYPRTPATIDNNSAILRKNYLAYIADANNRDSVDNYFLTVQDKFNYQAHHLISGNQIFAPMKKRSDGVKINRRAKLVRLANFCGYDINNAQNCIMLVANSSNTDKIINKSVSAYDTMSLSKIQWHVGGHSYKFSAEELQNIKTQINFYTKKISAAPPQNYVQLVSAELDKIETALASAPICRNTTQAKQGLITRLNNLSKKIKLQLGAFKEKPQKSFPYYVSKEAYLFAFNLPRTAKIILIRRAGQIFLFEKFRAERFGEVLTSGEGKTLIFNSKEEKNFPLDTRENKIACIEFCDNVEYFILAEGVNFADIEFLPRGENFTKKIDGAVDTAAKFLQAHDTEILIWLRDMQGEYQYTAIKRRIDERIKALEAAQ